VSVVLGKFFVTLEQEVTLRPLLVLWTYSFRESGGLVAVYVFDVFLYLLLRLAYGRVLKTGDWGDSTPDGDQLQTLSACKPNDFMSLHKDTDSSDPTTPQ
jgi:hypothetical protein